MGGACKPTPAPPTLHPPCSMCQGQLLHPPLRPMPPSPAQFTLPAACAFQRRGSGGGGGAAFSAPPSAPPPHCLFQRQQGGRGLILCCLWRRLRRCGGWRQEAVSAAAAAAARQAWLATPWHGCTAPTLAWRGGVKAGQSGLLQPQQQLLLQSCRPAGALGWPRQSWPCLGPRQRLHAQRGRRADPFSKNELHG